MAINRKIIRCFSIRGIILVIILIKIILVFIGYLSSNVINNIQTKENSNTEPSKKLSPIAKLCHPIGIDCYPNLAELFPLPRGESIYIPRKMKKKDYDTLMRLLNLTITLFEQNDIAYSVDSAGLIGSYVMHDLLPWDDHLGILIHNNSKNRLVELTKKGDHFGIQGIENVHQPAKPLKLFFKNSPQAGSFPWRWPFFDVECYVIDDDYIKIPGRGEQSLYMHRDWYFPTYLRPLGPNWIKVPHNLLGYLRSLKQLTCKTGRWDHQTESLQLVREADCDLLTPFYPFVKRTPFANITKETLVLNGTEYYNILVNDPYTEPQSKLGW